MAESEKPVLHHQTRSSYEASKPRGFFGVADVLLRFLLFASSLVAVLVMVTSKETQMIPVAIPGLPASTPPVFITRAAKFKHSPAFIYFIAALSVAGLYSIITTILSFFALSKRYMPTKLLSHLIIIDVLLLGIVSAATGSAGAVAYIGLKGNSHTGWTKICNRYHKFCRHIGSSVAVSLVASIVLVLLVLLNVYALSKKIPRDN